jgi:cobyrinic acid a,c-diamide synthase
MPLNKSLVIAGTHSGSGKTTIAIGIMSALKKRGLSVQPFKVGPDFIDPGYHGEVCGIPSRNLDGWMLDKKYNVKTFLKNSKGKDISIIEGVMGLYDGYSGKSEDGSTAQISKWFKTPVVLVVDARGMASSVGAIVYGFEKFDKQVNIAGVILNRVSSEKHYNWLKDAIDKRCKAKVIGYLPKDTSIEIPERHLGLVTSKENILKRDFIKRITYLINKHIDLDQLLKIASTIDRKRISPGQREDKINHTSGCPVKIGIACDEAFCFYYQDNFDILKQLGADLIYFSPLRDISLPDRLDGIYLGGGYPEVFARDLETNHVMRSEIKRFAARGGVIYAECGGLMYLGNNIKAFDKNNFKMSGVFPFTTRMEGKLKDLGYYTAKVVKNNILSKRGDEIRGHQFRYSSLEKIPQSLGRSYRLRKGETNKVIKEGFVLKNVLASYLHLHFGANINFARRFIESCRK